MCICCCICNCCNSYSSKCVELCILILSSITFICSYLNFLCIKWSHLTTLCAVLLIISMFFSTLLIVSSICINIFRYKGTINNSKNNFSIYISIISLILSILILLISLITESLVQTNFKDIDYPCKDLAINDNSNVIIFRFLELLTIEQKKKLCQNKNIDYNAKICSNLEYTMSYLTSSIIEICSLLLCFFMYNDYRRIKEKIEGELPIYDNAYLRKDLFHNGINYKEGDEGAESSDRYLNKNILVQSNVVSVKNKNSNSTKKSDNSDRNNFIRNLRREMQEGIESLEESSDKDNENNKKLNFKKNDDDKLYSEKSSKTNNDNSSQSNNKPNIIFVENDDSKNGSKDLKLDQKDISIYKTNENNNNNYDIFSKG